MKPVSIISAGLITFNAVAAFAQDYPSKPIRIIAGSVGGGNDITARLIAQGISGPLGQPVAVENRGGNQQAGFSGIAADGYTLFSAGSSLWLAPLLTKMPYDVVRDFTPISLMARTPDVLVVHAALPAKNVKELIVLAKSRPGELNYSIAGVGGSNHLAGELFKSLAGVNIVAVPYSTISQQNADLAAGQVQMTINGPPQVMGMVNARKLRALAVTSATPSALLPGVPPLGDTVPGYESGTMYGVLGPAKMPAAIVNRLHQEIVRVLVLPQSKERLLTTGLEVVASSPEQYGGTIKSEIAKWSKVIKDSGIKVE